MSYIWLSYVQGKLMLYVEATEKLRSECKEHSKKTIPNLGKRLPVCIKELDELLPLLSNVACCTWECPGQDNPHVLQHLIGKGVSQTLAGIELSLSGHYDEALLLARAVGEAANLSWLFWLAPENLEIWLTSTSTERWSKFRPAGVRKMITAKGTPVPIDGNRYSMLSSETTHPSPHSAPQNFNSEIPTLGGFYQEAGLIASLNELAAPIAILGGTGIKLIKSLPKEKSELITEKAALVLNNIGGLDLESAIKYARN